MSFFPTIQLLKVTPDANHKYRTIFEEFEHFSNYINFAFEFTSYEIWVDEKDNPTLACCYTAPAYFLWGDPENRGISPLFELFSDDCWIVPANEKWDQPLKSYFGDKLTTHQRTSFHSTTLDLAQLNGMKRKLPAGIQIEPININHINDLNGMLYQDLLQRFFSQVDFLQQGAGFCLMEDEKIIGFAAANYPIRNKILEVYIRVDYNNNPIHRQKGFGTQLAVSLLEYCLENGLNPQWDAANDISVNLALRLGYTLHHHWKMYHLQS